MIWTGGTSCSCTELRSQCCKQLHADGLHAEARMGKPSSQRAWETPRLRPTEKVAVVVGRKHSPLMFFTVTPCGCLCGGAGGFLFAILLSSKRVNGEEFVAHGANVNCLALGHKSGRVLVTGGDDKKVNLWAVGKPNCILSLSGHTTPVECVRFGGSEELVCAGSLSGALKIWDLEATKIVRTLTGHKANIRCIDFHPYGDFIGTGSLDTNIKLWDIRRKGCIFTYKGHNLTVNSLKFSPDGQWIASAGEDCNVKLWDLRAGKMMTEFAQHTGPVSDVEFHPHEFLLASASHDRTVNFWDLEKFSLVSSTDADTGPIRTIAFHPDGDCLYAGSPDILKVYGWEPARTFDTVAMGWGKIQDIAIAQNQLIGAGFHGVHVSLYVVDLKRVQPFGGPQQDVPSTFRHGAAIRKSFIKDKNSGKATAESMKTEEASDTGGEEPQEEDPPPEITNLNDYNSIFQTRRELQRTPPLPEPKPPINNNNDPMVPQVMTSPDVIRPEPLRAMPIPTTKPSTPDSTRRGSSHTVSHLPRPIPTPREIITPRDYSLSGNASPNLSQPYRARAVSESRRDSREPSSSSHEAEGNSFDRYVIRHSPSEPYLVRQSSSPGPPVSSPAYHDSAPHLPQLPRPDLTNLNRTHASSKPDLTSHSKPMDRPALVKPTSRVHGPQSPDVSYLNTPKNISPDISYMGTPKEPPDYGYSQDKMNDIEYSSSYSTDNGTINFEDFLPNKLSGLGFGSNGVTGIVGNEMSEQEVLSSIMRGHSSMMSVISARTRGLQVTHKLWQTKDLKTAVDHALNSGDQALLVDLLGIINLRPSIWNLDLLTALLPPVSLLLQSKYEMYVTCGYNALKLMIKNFAVMIKSNMSGPIHSVGVDISREERYNKCIECYNHMMSIRAFLLKRQTVPGKLGPMYRELVILMQAFE
ncbi:katanin p80 WD40 repeat-containing subunit B1-like isoform X4 [Penaeus chinensis]|uniref:katanin p80 WD40 repeat-containing subunit B1-like isoform X4 n=1 Tax=Penaeus chinensis TaxID=139456 RepID=UPI001FB6472F|nr:katanin p80 WD40 repeat-containing subunit B1-like isoform X4 [Penaeus chinensis]